MNLKYFIFIICIVLSISNLFAAISITSNPFLSDSYGNEYVCYDLDSDSRLKKVTLSVTSDPSSSECGSLPSTYGSWISGSCTPIASGSSVKGNFNLDATREGAV